MRHIRVHQVLDEYEQRITFDDNTQVKANEIIDIKGELFDNRAF